MRVIDRQGVVHISLRNTNGRNAYMRCEFVDNGEALLPASCRPEGLADSTRKAPTCLLCIMSTVR